MDERLERRVSLQVPHGIVREEGREVFLGKKEEICLRKAVVSEARTSQCVESVLTMLCLQSVREWRGIGKTRRFVGGGSVGGGGGK